MCPDGGAVKHLPDITSMRKALHQILEKVVGEYLVANSRTPMAAVSVKDLMDWSSNRCSPNASRADKGDSKAIN